ncbi:MAG: hypothetical protein HZB51_12115 [Chloroflexi bacterium]|nr:hypothetical protein [Chloroflexota bacterium]
MSADTEMVTQTLIDEGRKLMDDGDKTRAYAHFVTATDLRPDDEQLWMWRGETTDDPDEAMECFERVMELNPENHTAREKLVFVRLNNLQQEVRVNPDVSRMAPPANPTPFNFRTLVVAFTLLFIFLSVLVVGAVALWFELSTPGTQTRQIPSALAASDDEPVFPPTWTPAPTRTAVPTFSFVQRPSWKTTKETIVRIGPSTAYDKLGTLPKDSVIYIVGKSKDAKFLQIEYPDASRLAWIPADSAQIESIDLSVLAIPAAIPTLPPAPKSAAVAPAAKPSSTPLPAFEFAPASAPRNTNDCNRQTGVNGTVYSSMTNWQTVNDVIVRITAFGQVQNTIPTGIKGKAGYWEWYFTNNADVVGEIALINADGSLRSQPVSFHLTSCYGSGPGNQFTVDFGKAR